MPSGTLSTVSAVSEIYAKGTYRKRLLVSSSLGQNEWASSVGFHGCFRLRVSLCFLLPKASCKPFALQGLPPDSTPGTLLQGQVICGSSRRKPRMFQHVPTSKASGRVLLCVCISPERRHAQAGFETPQVQTQKKCMKWNMKVENTFGWAMMGQTNMQLSNIKVNYSTLHHEFIRKKFRNTSGLPLPGDPLLHGLCGPGEPCNSWCRVSSRGLRVSGIMSHPVDYWSLQS